MRGLTSAATKLTLLSVGALGVSCVATQLVLMREMLCVFTGNELVLGIVLGNWLLLMGAGAWLGRRAERLTNRVQVFICLCTLTALLPVVLLFVVRCLPLVVFARGVAISLNATILTSFLVLLPYCLAAGFLLTLACAVVAEAGDGLNVAGRVYVADCAGSIGGGVVFGVLLVWVINPFSLLAAVGFLNLGIAMCLAWYWRPKGFLLLAAVVGSFLVWMLIHTSELNSRQLEYASATILFQGNSPYGELVITRENRQTNFFQNGLPVLSTHNIERVEEAVHYAMAQRPDARRVLLIGGGVAGTAKELLKYRAEVTYLELDPLFLEEGRRFLPENLADPRIHVVNTDGRRFVQTTQDRFDVIILDLADPVTAQLNRFHTAEFFAKAKRALTTNGVLALAVGRYENFVSPELARMLATAHHTLQSVITNTVMVPGGRVFCLASDGALGLDIAERLERAQIGTRFVNRHYLDAMITPDRLADLERAVAQPAAVNRDFNPVLYFHCLRHWASQFDSRSGAVWSALGLALLVYVVRLRGAAAAVFAGGFAAASLEVVLLLGFQALCGSLYYQLGIIVTMFMAGLAVGAAWGNRRGAIDAERNSLRATTTQSFAELAGKRRDAEDAEQRGEDPALRNSAGYASLRLERPPADTALPRRVSSASIASQRLSNRGVLVLLALGVALFAAVLPLALHGLSQARIFASSDFAIQAGIGVMTFALAVLVGAQFPVANRVEAGAAGGAASRIYTADFLGASVGALLASAWLIPVLGVTMMCWIAAGLNLLGAGAVVLARPKLK